MKERTASYVSVGNSPQRVDAINKATGKALFVADIKLPNMLYGKVLRSRFPHAKILGIDTSKAQRLLGIRAVITAKDAPEVKFGTSILDQSVFASDKVRFTGEAIAAVAAVDEDTAVEALELISTDYEELPAVFDPEEAMKSGAPLIHENLHEYKCLPLFGAKDGFKPIKDTNILYHFKLVHGDAEKGLAEAEFIFDDTFKTQMIEHCAMEPFSVVADIGSSGTITIWASTNQPYIMRRGIAQALQVPVNQVRILAPYVGGSFGGKASKELCSIACLLAQKASKPVKIVMTREEEFTASTVRHPTIIRLKTGVTRDGIILARQANIIWDKGAYGDVGILVNNKASYGAAGPYKIPNVKIDAYSVYTNRQVSGALRGFGMPQVMWACESQIDMIAKKLGIDPLEIRLKNAVEENATSATGEVLHSVGLKQTLWETSERMGWRDRRIVENRGMGLACMWKSTEPRTSSSAFVKVDIDGTIQVVATAAECGQGIHTTLSQIAAEEMGVPLEDIRITSPDTHVTPYDFGQISSRSTFNLGNSIRKAVADAKSQLLEIAAKRLGANVKDLTVKNGRVYIKAAPEQAVSIAELAADSYHIKGGPVLGRGSFMLEVTPPDPETGQSKRPTDFWMYATQGVEVEVDHETGQVKVLRVVAAHDVGKAINPASCEGQIEGAIAMGLGSTLSEEILHENGKTLNPTFLDYKIFRASDMPEIETILVEEPHADGPFGAKGIGEPALAPTGPAIANAICNALDIRIKELPITPEKILQALKEKKQTDEGV